jgi:RNA polymerase sigma-70 factor (ECF subfamily)
MQVDAMPFTDPAETEARRIASGLRRKDKVLFHELVERYHDRLVQYVMILTGRRAWVEDVVQDTWLRVLERFNQYDGRSRFEPWLFSIARNLAIDGMRRRQNVSLDSAEEPRGGTSPFLAAARSEDAARVAAALHLLEPIYQETLLLRFQQDLSLHEISSVVGAPVPTVASRIRRGLAMLRSHCEGGNNGI